MSYWIELDDGTGRPETITNEIAFNTITILILSEMLQVLFFFLSRLLYLLVFELQCFNRPFWYRNGSFKFQKNKATNQLNVKIVRFQTGPNCSFAVF